MWIIQAIGSMLFLFACKPCRQVASVQHYPINDTVTVFKKDSSFITGSSGFVTTCPLEQQAESVLKSAGKTLLIFDQPSVISYPEGVYELYLTGKPPGKLQLSPSSPGFVSLLDLYSLSSPDAKPQIEVDISEAISKMLSNKQSRQAIYIVIRFGPVKLNNGTYSTRAGEMRFRSLRIVHVKN